MRDVPRCLGLLVFAAVLAAGCGDDDHANWSTEKTNQFAGYSSNVYANDAMWLCRSGLAHDYCQSDITATEIRPDGSLNVVRHEAAADPDFDCFYIYPTVNLALTPGNDTKFSDVRLKLDPLLSQAARFTSICRVFAPLYRQATIATYSADPAIAQPIFDIAYSDVLDAFKHYMGQLNHGRKFVLMGHSQGTGMLTRLVQEEFDNSPDLRQQLIVALLIGGEIDVPKGAVVGGTFRNVPLCTRNDQTGCVITYQSYDEHSPPPTGRGPAPGMETACTNPAALGGGKVRFAGTYLPNFSYQLLFRSTDPPVPGVDTPFTLYRNYYTGECVRRDDGVGYLQIGAEPEAGDLRPVRTLSNPVVESIGLGLHLLDYNLPLDDLIALVANQARATR